MKIILKIASAELKKLFYSPVAWFILVIFTFQTALTCITGFDFFVKMTGLGAQVDNLTNNIFAGQSGVFVYFSSYAYIYIPLVTMGIMSRELSTGSIKLLYSSPVTNWQIILGKYLSLMGFCLAFVGSVAVFALFGSLTITHADIAHLLSGLLGMYLLICAYSAIGLFVSMLTSYVVVAAIGTVGIFALLNYVKGIGQDIPLVRDITYWFSLSGRVSTFILGMITSEDVLYFIIVILLFLSFTLIKLQSGRQKVSWLVTAGKYLGVLLVALFLGYLSALPQLKFYKDFTYTQVNTLSKSSQKIISKVPDNTVITTYTNMLYKGVYNTIPANYKHEQKLFERYLRFNPTLKLKYVYFYHKTDNPSLDRLYPGQGDVQRLNTLKNTLDWKFKIVPYSAIENEVDLSSENYTSTRVIETPAGKKTFLRFYDDFLFVPTEAEISAAFKHLVADQPTVGFLTGQGERSAADEAEEGYSIFSKQKTYRAALINQGLDFDDVTLDKPVPAKIKVLVIADMKRAFTPDQQKNFNSYVAGGGNIMILGEPGRQSVMNNVTAQFGVRFLPGVLAHKPGRLSNISVKVVPTAEGMSQFDFLHHLTHGYQIMVMPTVSGLEAVADKGFHMLPWFATEPDSCWSELQTTNFKDDSATFDPTTHELKKVYPTVIGLDRMVGKKQQKIMIMGDADWLSNGELNTVRKQMTSNSTLSNAVFSWLCDGQAPVDITLTEPIDNSLKINKGSWEIWSIFLKWVFPGILTLIGIIIWTRRKGR